MWEYSNQVKVSWSLDCRWQGLTLHLVSMWSGSEVRSGYFLGGWGGGVMSCAIILSRIIWQCHTGVSHFLLNQRKKKGWSRKENSLGSDNSCVQSLEDCPIVAACLQNIRNVCILKLRKWSKELDELRSRSREWLLIQKLRRTFVQEMLRYDHDSARPRPVGSTHDSLRVV